MSPLQDRSSCPDSVDRMQISAALLACARGELPSNVALMRTVLAADDPSAVEQALEEAFAVSDARAQPRVQEILRLWQDAKAAWPVLRAIAVAMASERREQSAVAHWSVLFDRVAAISPEAGVALYSLGRADLLERATGEVVALMADQGLLEPGRIAVEIGCGIGRFLPPLAARGCVVLGIDVSPGMLAEAGRRCSHLPRAGLARTAGADLACLADATVDLVFAVDSFPYLVDAGLAAAHVAEAHRVLKPGGTLLVLNWSYRGDEQADRAEAARLAAETGFFITATGRADLRAWDGKVYRLDKPAHR
jgi:SAM-dependent methyltransferase